MDEFYNDAFAKKVVSIVSKMDDDEAEMFIRFSAYDVLMADIEANRRTVDQRVAVVHKRLQERVAKAAASLVSKNADIDLAQVAALVGTVSEVRKDKTNYEELYGKPQPRGKGGKWTVSIARQSQKDYKAPKLKKKQLKALKRGDLEMHNAARQSGDIMVGPQFNLTGALSRAGDGVSSFEREWNKKEDNPYSNERTYSRIAAGSQVLMQSNDPKMAAAGAVGNFFGQYGPQAERVVGPHLRKTAYRFRGTERAPDSKLINSANEMAIRTVKQETPDIDPSDRMAVTQALTPSMRTHASQQMAIRYFLGDGSRENPGRLPSKKYSKLQQASGKIPPSEGVMLNADGKIISQSVGYMDDHYLPFNLKNLKGLQGGSYVRTRSQGGLTTEDIYTGLVSGARSVTVVSRSGIFTVNFEDDFRGGRRYNDKAAGMVSRYAHTLDAVKSKQVEREPLKPEELADIRDEVERENKDNDWLSSADLEDLVKERISDYKSRPTLSKAELEAIDAEARKDNPDERTYRVARSEMISRAMEDKTQRSYQLDGEGYEVAMEALREQYPYYIQSVRAMHKRNLQADHPFTGEQDQGYVKPRYNRPAGAQAGFFDESINGKGKIGADQTNYQNWAYNSQNHTKAASSTEAAASGTATGKLKMGKDKRKERAEAAVEGASKIEADNAMRELARVYKTIEAGDDSDSRVIKEATVTDEKLESVLASPTERKKLEMALRSFHDTVGADTGDNAKKLHSKATGLFAALDRTASGAKWTGKEHQDSPGRPFRFDGDAYSSAAPAAKIQSEYAHQAGIAKISGRVGDVSDADLKRTAARLGWMAAALAEKDFNDRQFVSQAVSMGASEAEANRYADAREGGTHGPMVAELLKRSEAAHKARALRDHWDLSVKKESKKQEERATGTGDAMGFTGGGTSRGKLKSLPTAGDAPRLTPAESSKYAAYSVPPSEDTRAGNTIAMSRLQKSLAEGGEKDSASIVGAIKDEISAYYALPHADQEWLAERVVAHSADLPDDLQTKVEEWFTSRDFNK